jgi:hypothetical protein
MLSSESSNTTSTWGFVIFFLILFWFFGAGRGFGFNGGMPVGSVGFNGGMDQYHLNTSHQSERDVLDLGKTILEQNAQTAKTLSDMAYAQEAQTARILEGQKDLYIRDLERLATQQFVTSNTDQIFNKIDNMAAVIAMQRQNDVNQLGAQIAAVSNQMLKAPTPTALVGLNTVSCTNAVPSCGCGCFNS